MDYGKAIEKSTSHDERLSSVLGMSGGMSLQTDVFPLAPFLSAPLLTNYNIPW
jgi:AP2-like factor (ANT lineage)